MGVVRTGALDACVVGVDEAGFMKRATLPLGRVHAGLELFSVKRDSTSSPVAATDGRQPNWSARSVALEGLQGLAEPADFPLHCRMPFVTL